MYRLEIYDTRSARHRRLLFNSIDAAIQFVRETLRTKDMQTYIARMRASKVRDTHIFGPNHPRLYLYYGDVDEMVPSVATVDDDIKMEGKYEYRIGCLESMVQGGFGCVYFRLKNEYTEHTSVHIGPITQLAKQTYPSTPPNAWLSKPSFLS